MGTTRNKRNPWAWIPTLYFAEGLPNVIVTALSVVMYMQMGLTDAEVVSSRDGLPYLGSSNPCGVLLSTS